MFLLNVFLLKPWLMDALLKFKLDRDCLKKLHCILVVWFKASQTKNIDKNDITVVQKVFRNFCLNAAKFAYKTEFWTH